VEISYEEINGVFADPEGLSWQFENYLSVCP
jgi:hypothetical protein